MLHHNEMEHYHEIQKALTAFDFIKESHVYVICNVACKSKNKSQGTFYLHNLQIISLKQTNKQKNTNNFALH